MALNKTIDLAEEEKKKALEEELKARQQSLHKDRVEADRSRFADLFNPGSLQAQQAGEAMMAQSVFKQPEGTWDNTPGKLTGPEQWAVNALSPEAPRDPEIDAMVLGDGDAPVSPEQAQAQVDNRSKLQQGLDNLKVNAPVYNNAEAPDFVGQAFQQVETSPYNTEFNQLESNHGLPMGYLDATAMVESGKNPNAKNPRSSASGLFQFTDNTAKQYGLNDPFNPAESTDAMIRFTKDNQSELRRMLGREPSGEELYLAHQQGATGATKLLQANPNANASQLLGLDKVKLNGGNENTTVQEFKDLWAAKYNKYSGNTQPIQEAAPAQERIFSDDDVEATSDGGVSNATRNGIPQSAAIAASQRQYDENGKFVLKGSDEGLNFRSDFQHRDRSTTDMGALFQGLLAGGLAMLGTRLAGGDSDEAGLAFAVGAGGRFINAMNESHRYKNVESLTKMGYTPESIEDYISTGQRDSLKKFEYGKWEDYPDGSGDMYRQLPNGDTEFRKGVPKWETIDTVNENGETVRSYFNPVHGWRQRSGTDGVQQKFEHVVSRPVVNRLDVQAGATPQIYVQTNPQTGQKEEVSVFTVPQGFVSVTDRKTPITLQPDAQLKEKPTAASLKAGSKNVATEVEIEANRARNQDVMNYLTADIYNADGSVNTTPPEMDTRVGRAFAGSNWANAGGGRGEIPMGENWLTSGNGPGEVAMRKRVTDAKTMQAQIRNMAIQIAKDSGASGINTVAEIRLFAESFPPIDFSSYASMVKSMDNLKKFQDMYSQNYREKIRSNQAVMTGKEGSSSLVNVGSGDEAQEKRAWDEMKVYYGGGQGAQYLTDEMVKAQRGGQPAQQSTGTFTSKSGIQFTVE